MFPKELRDKKQWVCWRLTPDKDGGKPKKVPINPITGKGAMSNKPETWTDYNTAADARKHYGYTGIGYMFMKGDGIVGVDIDHCYNPETGEFNEIAAAIIARQPTYTEFSPSGDGVHLYYKGSKPSGSSKNTKNGVEMYQSGRYFTVTGKQLPGTPNTVSDGADTLAWIYETYIKNQRKQENKKKKNSAGSTVEMSDEELIEKAKNSEDGDTFSSLLEGNWQSAFQSQSEQTWHFAVSWRFGQVRTRSR